MKKALILVDIQNDFCKNGSLAVKDGETIIPLVNKLTDSKEYDLVVATQDFHPANHSSFVSNNPNGIWPDHCVQGTKGVEMHPDLDMKKVVKIFQKGVNTDVDSYSGFFDNDKKTSTGLGEWLKKQGIDAVDVVGLALDYCVKATAIDAQALGFDTQVILAATKAVNINVCDDQKAILDLINHNVKIKR